MLGLSWRLGEEHDLLHSIAEPACASAYHDRLLLADNFDQVLAFQNRTLLQQLISTGRSKFRNVRRVVSR